MKCVELAQNRAKDRRDTKFYVMREFGYVNNNVMKRAVRLSLIQTCPCPQFTKQNKRRNILLFKLLLFCSVSGTAVLLSVGLPVF